MNTEVLVALIGMAATAWAPTVTALVAKDKELKLKKLEIYQSAKKDAYIHFSIACSKMYRLIQPDAEEAIKDVISASHNVLIYCSEVTYPKVVELINIANTFPFAKSEDQQRFHSLLYETLLSLNTEISEDCE